MTELSFAKSFLQTLDSKPSKISSTHLEDPRNYPARSAYILPKAANTLPRKTANSSGTSRIYTVSLKSLRNPPLDITLTTQPPQTSILQLKEAISSQTGISVPKLRLLFAKKPIPDSRVLKDLVKDGEDDGGKLEFSVMVIGFKKEEVKEEVGAVAQGESGLETLRTEEFWGDLKGFLIQRLRNEEEGERVYGLFKKAWEREK